MKITLLKMMATHYVTISAREEREREVDPKHLKLRPKYLKLFC